MTHLESWHFAKCSGQTLLSLAIIVEGLTVYQCLCYMENMIACLMCVFFFFAVLVSADNSDILYIPVVNPLLDLHISKLQSLFCIQKSLLLDTSLSLHQLLDHHVSKLKIFGLAVVDNVGVCGLWS